MILKHTLGSEKKSREVSSKDRTFLLGNDLGDYLWFGGSADSRYQGWFITDSKDKETAYKIIEDIRSVDRGEIKVLENMFSKVVRKGDGFKESFTLDKDSSRFIYQLEDEKEVELVLDMRKSYSDDYPEYDIEDLNGRLLITGKGESETLFLAIKGFCSYRKEAHRFVRHYEADKKRSSPPFEKAVFKALTLKGSRFIFSASKNKEKALNNLDKRIKVKRARDRKEPLDFVAAWKGLDNLVVDEDGIYAGFPWFFQYWKRDEAISLRGLSIIDKQRAKNIFWSLISRESRGPRGNPIADGIGWTYKRAFLFLNELTNEEEGELANELKKDVDIGNSDFRVTKYKETWMDSISREGARIEVQALQLSMYKLGKLIDKENKEAYLQMEAELREKVRDVFWDGEVLADGYDPETEWVDKTVRPNIFLAYYIYPELLSPSEWEICFRKALYELWLDWGGLSTISQKDHRYREVHTGENPESYHQGDSWFFVNNLAAIAMHRLNEGRFAYEINKILKASRNDLLWNGAIGHHSEVSSAKSQRAEGAISQAWSFATYLEALYEVFKIRNFNWD